LVLQYAEQPIETLSLEQVSVWCRTQPRVRSNALQRELPHQDPIALTVFLSDPALAARRC
jgi:hypothetical protein